MSALRIQSGGGTIALVCDLGRWAKPEAVSNVPTEARELARALKQACVTAGGHKKGQLMTERGAPWGVCWVDVRGEAPAERWSPGGSTGPLNAGMVTVTVGRRRTVIGRFALPVSFAARLYDVLERAAGGERIDETFPTAHGGSRNG